MKYDEQFIYRVSSDLAERISIAALDHSKWLDVVETFAAALPGAFVALHNVSMSDQRFNVGVAHGIDPAFLKSYEEYYIGINPWFPSWSRTPSGRVLVATDTSPASQFSDSEFYNDWILPQNGVEGAVGMKLDLPDGDAVQVPVHFPIELSQSYNRVAAELLVRIRGPLKRAILHARLLQTGLEQQIAQAALLDRTNAMAIVVDAGLKIVEHNEIAERAIRTGAWIGYQAGHFSIADRGAMKWLCEFLELSKRGIPRDWSSYGFRCGATTLRLSVNMLPLTMSTCGLPSHRHPLTLLLVENLTAPRTARHLCLMRGLYGLTEAETAMVSLLGEGITLVEACDRLQITQGTGRQRLKSIFAKTDTHRQSELIQLVERMS